MRSSRATLGFASVLGLVGLLGGCKDEARREPEPQPRAGASAAAQAASAAPPAAAPSTVTAAASASAAPLKGPLVLVSGVRIVEPKPTGDAISIIRAERERAAADGRDLIVYVGAKWCEPCQRLHHAAERGELDADFPSLTLLAFDLDVDRDRLVAAGYTSELIPLFVVPDAEGRATKRRFEGSVKGDRAVSNIAPKLRALLSR